MNAEEFIVAVYLVQRCYGGPEEGGWYFDAGELHADIAPIPCPASQVRAALDVLGNAIEKDGLNVGRPELNSVLSNGVYVALAFRGQVPPRLFPEARPRYC